MNSFTFPSFVHTKIGNIFDIIYQYELQRVSFLLSNNNVPTSLSNSSIFKFANYPSPPPSIDRNIIACESHLNLYIAIPVISCYNIYYYYHQVGD